MPREQISMRKMRDILRLHHELQCSNRSIARSLRISDHTVGKYLRRSKEVGLSWPLPDGVSDADLEARLFPAPDDPVVRQRDPDWEEIKRQLARKGVTLRLLHEEYREANPGGYSYSRFCH